jgi:hypothetical protein
LVLALRGKNERVSLIPKEAAIVVCDATTKSHTAKREITKKTCDVSAVYQDSKPLQVNVTPAARNETVGAEQGAIVYRFPVNARIIKINRINPSPPLGQYPQPEL